MRRPWHSGAAPAVPVRATPDGRRDGGAAVQAGGILHHGSVVAVVSDAPPENRQAGHRIPDPGPDPCPDPGTDAALPRAVLITGASGSGKSALAVMLMALGARLVADDGVLLHPRRGRLIATCPAALEGLIEARGVGLLRAQPLPEAQLVAVVDMDHVETDRLPHPRSRTMAGIALACLHKVDAAYFPAAIMQYLRAGRVETR